MNTLVLYFSASGVTERTAQKLAKNLGADLQEIVPAKRYTQAELNWRDGNSRSSLEMKDISSRPAIVGKYDVEKYDRICIGFPIWWYTAPRIIQTFIESVDLTDKEIVLFATSGGSGISKTVEEMRNTYPGLNFVSAKLMNSDSDITL